MNSQPLGYGYPSDGSLSATPRPQELLALPLLLEDALTLLMFALLVKSATVQSQPPPPFPPLPQLSAAVPALTPVALAQSPVPALVSLATQSPTAQPGAVLSPAAQLGAAPSPTAQLGAALSPTARPGSALSPTTQSAAVLSPPPPTPLLHASHQSPSNNLPGPAVAILSRGDGREARDERAVIAAAALQEAANVPLIPAPLQLPPVPPNTSSSGQSKQADRRLLLQLQEALNDNSIARVAELRQELRRRAELETSSTQDEEPSEDDKVKREEQEGCPPGYQVDPDAGTILCVCGFSHDDGFTVQCDLCNRWQHLVCMGLPPQQDVSGTYHCLVCKLLAWPHLDGDRAKRIQTLWLEQQEPPRRRENRRKTLDSVDGGEEGVRKKRRPTKDGITVEATHKRVRLEGGEALDDEELLADLAADETHQAVYFHLNSTSEYKNREIRHYVQVKLPQLLGDSLRPELHQTVLCTAKMWAQMLRQPLPVVKNYNDSKKQKFSGISRLALFSTQAFSPGMFVAEVLGELDFKANYIDNSVNQYRVWGTPKPRVVFHPLLPVMVDARFSGNATRFIRRLCSPNCRFAAVLVGPEDHAPGRLLPNHQVKFAVFTTKTVDSDLEFTFPWEWDARHPVHKLMNHILTFDRLSDREKAVLIGLVEHVLAFCECACSGALECLLAKVKRTVTLLKRNNIGKGGIVLKPGHTRYSELVCGDAVRQQPYIPFADRSKQLVEQYLALPVPRLAPAPLLGLVAAEETPLPSPEPAQYPVEMMPYRYRLIGKERPRETAPVPDVEAIAVPVRVLLMDAKDKAPVPADGERPVAPVKKLSFADYIKKKVV